MTTTEHEATNTSVLDYDPSVYYQGRYWNDYNYVARELNRRISGDPDVPWTEHFRKTVGGRVFRKALILNCGNGWVERDLLQRGLIAEAVGVDYAEPLLQQARAAAGDLPARYYQLDTNTAAFPEGDYDLVVNFAAAHHITYLDRVFRELCKLLPADGCFVSYDYVGPHRNQYGTRQWLAALSLNRRLPPHMRQIMRYPHLLTMKLVDPSEAVHSELVVPMTRRYFHIVDHQHMGGALAYLVLTHNDRFWNAKPEEQARWLKVIMDADADYLRRYPDSSMFDYILAQPNKHSLEQTTQLDAWTREEEEREATAQRNNGLYYRQTLYAVIFYRLMSTGSAIKRRLMRRNQ